MPNFDLPNFVLIKIETDRDSLWVTVEAVDELAAFAQVVRILGSVAGVGGTIPPIKALRRMQRGPGLGEAAQITVTQPTQVRGNREAWLFFGLSAQFDAMLHLAELEHRGGSS